MVHRFQVKDLNLTMIEEDRSLDFRFGASGWFKKVHGHRDMCMLEDM